MLEITCWTGSNWHVVGTTHREDTAKFVYDELTDRGWTVAVMVK